MILLKSPSKLIFGAAFLASLSLVLTPTPQGLDADVMTSAAVVVLAIALWSTAVIPSVMGSLVFLLVAVVLAVAPPEVVFSGFHAGAIWLVFGGVVIGLGVKRSGLDTRLVNRFLARIPATYLGVVYSIFFAAFMLAWIVPSASARVALLVPIMIALSEGLGFKKGSKGQTGLVLASAMGTMTPAFGILPANVPNMALFGAIESIHGIRLTYGEYLLLNFPVLGIGALVLYPLVIGVLFKDHAEAAVPQEVPRKWSISERKLLAILVAALALWITDTWHGVSPAWVALGAALLCLFPKIGLLQPKTLGADIDLSPVIFLAGVIGLGAVATHSGLGAFIAEKLLAVVELESGADQRNYSLLVLVGSVIGLITTMPAQPSIMVPMAEAMASASGWSIMSAFMAPVVTWSMFPFFYQAPPVVLAVALGDLRISWVIKMLLAYMVVSTILLLPLHFLWGQYLGFFVGT